MHSKLSPRSKARPVAPDGPFVFLLPCPILGEGPLSSSLRRSSIEFLATRNSLDTVPGVVNPTWCAPCILIVWCDFYLFGIESCIRKNRKWRLTWPVRNFKILYNENILPIQNEIFFYFLSMPKHYIGLYSLSFLSLPLII